MSELSGQYEIHPTVINKWKRKLLEEARKIFEEENQGKKGKKDSKAQIDELYRQIGQLKVEKDFLANRSERLGLPTRKTLVNPKDCQLSIEKQCELLGISRSSYYYNPQEISEEESKLLRLLDEQYMKTPFYGSRKMTMYLRSLGYRINRKRVMRLMRQLGLQTIYPKPRTSIANKEHEIYPYLLRELNIEKSNQVWCTDITYLPIGKTHFYLVAIMDWFSS